MNRRLAYIISFVLFLVAAKMAWDWVRHREPTPVSYDPSQSGGRMPEHVTLRGVWLAHADFATGSRWGRERTYAVVRSRQSPETAASGLVVILSDPACIAAIKVLVGKSSDKPDAEALRALATLAAKEELTGVISTSAVNSATRVSLRDALPALRPGYAVLVEGEKPSLGPVLLGFAVAGCLFFAVHRLRPEDSVDGPEPAAAAPAPGGARPAAPPLQPLLAKAPSAGFRQEILRELEAVDREAKDDVVTVGIGMIKLGAPELLPGWLRSFAAADVYVVSVEAQKPETAFVFGPEGDRNYVAVFTRLALAMQCLREMPQLKFTMKLKGADLLQLAAAARRGLWVNPLNEACTIKFPAVMIPRFIKEANRG